MKKCTTCKLEKPFSDFNKNKSKKDGYNTLCRVCSNKRSKQYYKENAEHHKKIITERNKKIKSVIKNNLLNLLKNSKCTDCGNDDIRVLEFDHLPQFKKEKNISDFLKSGCSWNVIQKEINKCEIVCANCHRIRTVNRLKKSYRKQL